MNFLRRYRWILLGVGLTAAVLAFLAFRPDKLFVDDAVDETLSDAFVTETTEPAPPVDETTTQPPTSSTNGTTPTTTKPTPPTSTTEAPSGPIAIATGEFFGIDHSAEGTSTVYEQGGTYVLRFEDNTDIQNGPDLLVWLLADDEHESGIPSDYIDLGKIKGNVGGQNYELPSEYDPDVHLFVLIWCLRFNTPFAGAPLA